MNEIKSETSRPPYEQQVNLPPYTSLAMKYTSYFSAARPAGFQNIVGYLQWCHAIQCTSTYNDTPFKVHTHELQTQVDNRWQWHHPLRWRCWDHHSTKGKTSTPETPYYWQVVEFVPHLFSKFFVLGGQRFAMATPGSVEFKQHILPLSIHDLIEILPHYNLWWQGITSSTRVMVMWHAISVTWWSHDLLWPAHCCPLVQARIWCILQSRHPNTAAQRCEERPHWKEAIIIGFSLCT